MLPTEDSYDIQNILPTQIRSDTSARESVERAWEYAKQAHKGQLRRSGKPYIDHLFGVAQTLGELNAPPAVIMAGILHDTIEDTPTTEADIEKLFGKDVAFLVSGVTKIEESRHSTEPYDIEEVRRVFVAAAENIGVLIIKLCDRLHNMRTLEFLKPHQQERMALETIEIYVPTADRLGMNAMKRELEERSFPYIAPKEYEETRKLYAKRLAEREASFSNATAQMKAHLDTKHIQPLEIEQRPKGLYSFFKKMERKGGDISAINDILTLQIKVPTIDDCYQMLGYVHALWRPVPAKMKDYISFPKPNGYQCLRTAVDANELGIIEVHIYTFAMFEHAQKGITLKLARK